MILRSLLSQACQAWGLTTCQAWDPLVESQKCQTHLTPNELFLFPSELLHFRGCLPPAPCYQGKNQWDRPYLLLLLTSPASAVGNCLAYSPKFLDSLTFLNLWPASQIGPLISPTAPCPATLHASLSPKGEMSNLEREPNRSHAPRRYGLTGTSWLGRVGGCLL